MASSTNRNAPGANSMVTLGGWGTVSEAALRCSTCHEIPIQRSLGQCRNAHLICQRCLETTVACVICGLVFETNETGDRLAMKINCHEAVDAIIDHFSMTCRYRDQGCTESAMSREQMQAHVGVCEFRPNALLARRLRAEVEARNGDGIIGSVGQVEPILHGGDAVIGEGAPDDGVQVEESLREPVGGAFSVGREVQGQGEAAASKSQVESPETAPTNRAGDGGDSMEMEEDEEVSGIQRTAEEEIEAEAGGGGRGEDIETRNMSEGPSGVEAGSASASGENGDGTAGGGEGRSARTRASSASEEVRQRRASSNVFSGGLGDRVYPECIFCKKTYANLASLRDHYERCHSNEQKTARCIICDEHYWDTSLAAKHISNNHHQPTPGTQEEPGFYCAICREKTKKFMLYRHLVEKHSEELK